MAHYAFLDNNNIVTEVIPGRDEGELAIDWEVWYGNFRGQTCRRTSYNTFGGRHRGGGTPFRKNFAGVGYCYDARRNAFLAPQPYPSWVLDEQSGLWQAPIPEPTEGRPWRWNEEEQTWHKESGTVLASAG
ncbi:MAG: hypothetical protein HQM06_04370 [Magnetococcales bacterium]|nr:hypothetical protein [Magnetococcales bacterium]